MSANIPDKGAAPPSGKASAWSLIHSGGFFLLGAVVTAVVSTTVAMYFSRPRLQVYLTSVSIDTPSAVAQKYESEQRSQQGLYSYGSAFPRNATLITLSSKSDWVPSLGNGNFDTYLSTLYAVRQRSGAAKNNLAALSNDLSNWPDQVTATSIDSVYSILRSNADTVAAVIFGDVREGRPVFQGSFAKPNSSGFYDIATDSDGDFYVDSGKRRLPILWVEECRSEGGDAAVCKELADRYATAVAYCVQGDLSQLKAALESDVNNVRELTQLYKESTAEIERYSYWRVTVTLTNEGKEALAVSPWAMMRIQPPQEATAAGNPLASPADSDKDAPFGIAVQMVESVNETMSGSSERFQYEQPTEEPAVIEGGKAISVTFRSVDRISTPGKGERALELFKSAKHGASVTVAVLPLTSPSGARRKAVSSQEMNFRDLGNF